MKKKEATSYRMSLKLTGDENERSKQLSLSLSLEEFCILNSVVPGSTKLFHEL